MYIYLQYILCYLLLLILCIILCIVTYTYTLLNVYILAVYTLLLYFRSFRKSCTTHIIYSYKFSAINVRIHSAVVVCISVRNCIENEKETRGKR